MLDAQGVLAVLVLYGRRLEDAAPWPFILTWLESEPRKALRHCLIYDNSPIPVEIGALPTNASVVCDPDNGGTASAYSFASERAAKNGCEWLLLLDQDTILPEHYLDYAEDAILGMPQAVALVPSVRHGSHRVSPSTITPYGSIRPCENPGLVTGITTAISSGVIIRRTAIAETIFPPEIWLDYVDHWIFLNLSRRGSATARIDAELSHNLSIRTPATLSIARLRSILAAETAFYKSVGGRSRVMLPLRRIVRACRYLLIGRPSLASVTFAQLVQRTSPATND